MSIDDKILPVIPTWCDLYEMEDKFLKRGERILELEAQLAERDAMIRDGITHLCSYCMDNKERSWEEMQQHIHECEKHPLPKAEAQRDRVCLWKRQKLGTDCWDEYDSWGTSCGEDYAIEEEWDDKVPNFCNNCGGKAKAAIKVNKASFVDVSTVP